MATGLLSVLAWVVLLLGLLAIAGGIVLLVVGSRRHDDSTSRPFLSLGITALVIGTALAIPALIGILMPLMAA
ncbi:hypothetical protein [Agrococcus beijingensis]|uniref:hypothetical protein n=1 Tax=Agrococcus beijingensis TaxID=3068634 RepID=UPI0027429AAE|nr:hypothetical protein [Agrococcus sp. REN33]